MAVQTTYDSAPAERLPGKLADNSYDRVTPCFNDDAASLPFGKFVGFAVGGRPRAGAAIGVAALTGASVLADVAGFLLSTNSLIENVDYDSVGLKVDAVGSMVRFGCVTAISETAAVAGDPVFVRIGGAGVVGSVRNAADGVNTVQIKGAYLNNVSASGVAEFDFSLIA